MKGYVVFDIETTIRTHLGRKASPFGGDNWVVAAGYKASAGVPGVHGTYWGRDKTGSHGWLGNLLVELDPQYLVGFNIKFDIQWMIQSPQDYEVYQAWIASGGQLWDTQLVEYLLDGQKQESQMLSLDEVAPRYGGSLKIDEVKAMWAEGIDTPDIPRQLLMDYLTGRGEDLGDVENTELIFLGQIKAAKKAGQVKSIQLNNGALVATIEMERNGLYVDVEMGRKQAAVMTERIAELRADLSESLPKDLPFKFNWGSRKQLSALIFGGQIKYKAPVHELDDDGHPAYAKMDVTHYVLADGGTTALPPGSAGMPDSAYVFFASGKQKGLPKTKKVKVNDPTRPKIYQRDHWYKFPRITKPNPEWESKSDKGVYSTSADVIEELGGRGIPFLDKLSELADMTKDLGTYYITEEMEEDEETGEMRVKSSKGMLTLVHDDGLVHANICMTCTVTARFAHAKPNIGNLPRNDTSEVKQMFVSRWLDEGEMQSSDFTSLEVYIQAYLSGDKQLISDLRNRMDMHIKRLAQAEGKTYEEVFDLVKKQMVKEWVNKRKNIKTFSFQRAYGAGAPKIARFLKVAVELVEKWQAADEEMYPGVLAYQNKVAEIVKQSRKPEQRFAVHPQAKVNLQLGIGHYRTFDGKLYTFREQPAPEFMLKRGTLQSFKPTETKNYPVQGMGGEWMKAAMWMAVRTFYRYKNFGGLALLVNTVHDALYADAHKSVSRKSGVVLHASMMAASDFMDYWFGHTIPVSVPSETTHGPSMFVEEPFDDHEAFLASANKVRTWMRETYMEGHEPAFLEYE